MKRKCCFSLALLLVLLQMLGSAMIFSATAVGAPVYTFPCKTSAVTLDGAADPREGWEDIEWTVFTNQFLTSTEGQAGYSAKFKGQWKEEGGKKYVYFFVEVNDSTVSAVSDWRGDAIWFNYNTVGGAPKGETHYWTATLSVQTVAQTDHVGNGKGVFTYAMKDERETRGVYTVEARFDVGNADTFFFDLLTQDNCMASDSDSNRYARYSWGGLSASQGDMSGSGILAPQKNGETLIVGEDSPGHYHIYQAIGEMNVNGTADEMEAWNNIPWSNPFSYSFPTGSDETHPVQAAFSARMKMAWQKEQEAAYLYFLIEVEDQTVGAVSGNWLSDYFGIAVDENADGTNELDTAALYFPVREDVTYPNLIYKIADRRAEKGGYTVEARYTFQNAGNCVGNIRFDILLNDNIMASSADSNRYVRYSWGGIQQTGTSNISPLPGVGTISPLPVFSVQSAKGASIRIDTAEPEKSGIRFATAANAEAISALTAEGAAVTTGTLLLPTSVLTTNGMTDLTKAELAATGLQSGIDYYDIINIGNTWVTVDGAEQTGTWYGTLFHIKNFSREFSAVGYVTVELADGTVYTLYGGFDLSGARSVSYVAGEVLKNEELGAGGVYNAEQEAILQNFLKGATQS